MEKMKQKYAKEIKRMTPTTTPTATVTIHHRGHGLSQYPLDSTHVNAITVSERGAPRRKRVVDVPPQNWLWPATVLKPPISCVCHSTLGVSSKDRFSLIA